MKNFLFSLFASLVTTFAILLAATPARPQVVAQTATVNLSWTASATAGVNYNVYQENASGACTPTASVTGPACLRLNSTPQSGLTYTASPTIGNQYFYVVRAVNALGIESVNSNETPLNLTTPGAPGVLTCTITVVNGVAAGTCK